LREEIESLDRQCEIIAADLADSDACVKAAEKAGRIDICINNAGIGKTNHDLFVRFKKFEINYFATHSLSQHC
jgi:short-subunit dehydrogenase